MTSIMSFEDDEATKAERPPMTAMVVKTQRPGILLQSQVNELLTAIADLHHGGTGSAIARIEEVLKVGGYEGAMPAAPALPTPVPKASAPWGVTTSLRDEDEGDDEPSKPVPAKPATPVWVDEADAPFISGS
jgi:hypothetical protein